MASILELGTGDWQTLQRHLERALELPADEREAFVESLAGQLGPLTSRLRALLAHAQATTPALGGLPGLGIDDAGLQPGRVVGPYRLQRRLGEGGMGSVWLAERTDMLQRRPVALKLPRAWAGHAVAERMVREREILAALEHPHIARLYDAGLDADGQPWLALEYVEGESIDRHVAALGLPVRARLELMLQVLRAVAFAHARLVVHRDLKPSNILVGADGQVRLLDFGIAKLMAGDGPTPETDITRIGGAAFTPEYASPEQLAGEPIGTASDIYSLGVVLFELLTGRRRHGEAGGVRAALVAGLAEAEPPLPSRVAADATTRRALRGDLDAIVLKALNPVPGERYATVEAMAADIERHLRREPVLALSGGHGYRLRRFVARHRLAIAAAAMAGFALLTGAAVAMWQAREARLAQRHAEEVKDFVAALIADADPFQQGRRPLGAADLLRRARTRIDRIAPDRAATRVELLTITGRSLLHLGDTAEAAALLRQAVELSERALGADDSRTLRTRLALSEVFATNGDRAAAEPLLVDLIPRLAASGDVRGQVHALRNLAQAELDAGRHERAIERGRQAFDLALARLGDRDTDTVAASNLLAHAHQYGNIEVPRLLAAAERGMAFALAAHGDQPEHVQVVQMRRTYADSLNTAGRSLEALAQYELALRGARVALGPGSSLEGRIAGNMVAVQRRQGELRAALASSELAIAVQRAHVEPRSRTWGDLHSSRGNTLLQLRRAAAAMAAYDEALDILTSAVGAEGSDALSARLNRGLALAYNGRHEEADREIAAAQAGYRKTASPFLHYALHVQGIAARLAGRPAQALALQRQALALAPAGGLAEWNRLRMVPEVGLALVELGRHREALGTLDEAARLAAKLQTAVTPSLAEVWLAAGRARLALRQPEAALVELRRAEAFWREFDPAHEAARTAATWVARAEAARPTRKASPAAR